MTENRSLLTRFGAYLQPKDISVLRMTVSSANLSLAKAAIWRISSKTACYRLLNTAPSQPPGHGSCAGRLIRDSFEGLRGKPVWEVS
jgi:hypothetical protein